VGPNLALKILSGMSVDELAPAIRKGDLAQLTRIPGIGRKTAERMVVELRDKMAAVVAAEETHPTTYTGIAADAISALLNLGYDRRAAEKAVEEARRDGAQKGFEALLRTALQQLSHPGGARPSAAATRHKAAQARG
jgi:holliday junction DNA helicase RuvA